MIIKIDVQSPFLFMYKIYYYYYHYYYYYYYYYFYSALKLNIFLHSNRPIKYLVPRNVNYYKETQIPTNFDITVSTSYTNITYVFDLQNTEIIWYVTVLLLCVLLDIIITTYNTSRAVAVQRCFRFHPVTVLKQIILSTF